MTLQRQFDCTRCIEYDVIKRRTCYNRDFGSEAHTIRIESNVTKTNADGTSEDIFVAGQEFVNVTSDELFDVYLSKVLEALDISPYEAMHIAFPKVCMRSLITQEVAEIIEMEAFCLNYHVPPLGAATGYLEYPQRMVDAFSIVNDVRERLKMKEMKREAKTGKG